MMGLGKNGFAYCGYVMITMTSVAAVPAVIGQSLFMPLLTRLGVTVNVAAGAPSSEKKMAAVIVMTSLIK